MAILKKDRKEVKPETKVIGECRALINTLSKNMATNDENQNPKISKRKMNVIGYRLLEHSIDAFEELRYQDQLYPVSKKARDTRVAALYRADKALSNLVSDLDLLPILIPTCNHKENWYNNMQREAINCQTHTSHLRESIEQKYNKINAEERKNPKKTETTTKVTKQPKPSIEQQQQPNATISLQFVPDPMIVIPNPQPMIREPLFFYS